MPRAAGCRDGAAVPGAGGLRRAAGGIRGVLPRGSRKPSGRLRPGVRVPDSTASLCGPQWPIKVSGFWGRSGSPSPGRGRVRPAPRPGARRRGGWGDGSGGGSIPAGVRGVRRRGGSPGCGIVGVLAGNRWCGFEGEVRPPRVRRRVFDCGVSAVARVPARPGGCRSGMSPRWCAEFRGAASAVLRHALIRSRTPPVLHSHRVSRRVTLADAVAEGVAVIALVHGRAKQTLREC